jgi:hypothetical protein
MSRAKGIDFPAPKISYLINTISKARLACQQAQIARSIYEKLQRSLTEARCKSCCCEAKLTLPNPTIRQNLNVDS